MEETTVKEASNTRKACISTETSVGVDPRGRTYQRDAIVNGEKLVPPSQIGEKSGTGREGRMFVRKVTKFVKNALHENLPGADTGADVGKFAD